MTPTETTALALVQQAWPGTTVDEYAPPPPTIEQAPKAAPLALRPYQQDAANACRAAWATGTRRVLVSMPTGTGKTRLAVELIAERVALGQRCLAIAPRKELIDQAIATLHRQLPPLTTIGRCSGADNETGAQVVVATAQTLCRANRLAALLAAGGFGLIWVDEAHCFAAPQNREMLTELGCWADDGPDLLGVTATIDRLDDIDLGHLFEIIAYRGDLAEMIDAGYLAPPQARMVPSDMDLSRVHSVGNELNGAELETEMLRSHVAEAILDAWQTFGAGRKRTLVFVPKVRIAEHVAEVFAAAGVVAEAISGRDSSTERAAKLDRHRSGETTVLCNALLLTLGYDDPEIDTIIWARPTQSRALVTQAIGRGLRPWPGKTSCLILDLIGTSSSHKLVNVADIHPPAAMEAAKLFLGQVLAHGPRRSAEVARLGRLAGLNNDVLRLASEKLRVDAQQVRGEWWVSLPAAEVAAPKEPGSGTPTPDDVDTLRGIMPTAVDMVGVGSRLAWRKTGYGWVLPGGVRLVSTGDEWSVVDPEGSVVAHGLDLGYAMGAAEDWVRANGMGALTAADAPWRTRPPTEKQAALFARWSVPCPATRGEAADLMTAEFERRKRKPRHRAS